MTRAELRLEALRLKALRAKEDVSHTELRISIRSYLHTREAKAVAADFGVSEQFLSDIRHGRRKISDQFLESLCSK